MDNTEEEGRTVGKQDKEEDRSMQSHEKAYIEENKRVLDLKSALRQSNLNLKRPGIPLGSRSADSEEVLKKLEVINDEVKEVLIAELKSVDLSNCLADTVSLICVADLSSTRIQAVIEVCSTLHQMYIDFSPCLIQGLLKVFLAENLEESYLDKSVKATKKANTLRLLIELHTVGIVEDICSFRTIIEDLTSVEHLKDRETIETNLSLLAFFVSHGKHFLGLQEQWEDANYEVRIISVHHNVLTDHTTRLHKRYFALAN